MQEPNSADNRTTQHSTGSTAQPDDDLLSIFYTYRETIHKLSIQLIDHDWSELKSDSSVIKTVEEQLRDVIKNLEKLKSSVKLRSIPIWKTINMDDILKAINTALKELYRAKDLAKESNVQVTSTLPVDKYDKFQSCRDYIGLAMGLMPSEPEISISDPSVAELESESG